MAEFTSTVLQTLESDSVRGTQKYSMWEDTIRTSALARAGLGLDMIMQSKMEMLLLEDSLDPGEMETRRSFQQMLRDGLKLWLQKLQKSFGDYWRSWILVRWYDPSHSAEHTPSIATVQFGKPTNLRRELNSNLNEWQDSVNGLKVILWDIQKEVSCLARLSGVRLAKARFGGILPGGAPPTPQPPSARALDLESELSFAWYTNTVRIQCENNHWYCGALQEWERLSGHEV